MLQHRLTGDYQVLSPDLYGSGDSPPWRFERELTLADEVALVEPVFEAAGEAIHLVGRVRPGRPARESEFGVQRTTANSHS